MLEDRKDPNSPPLLESALIEAMPSGYYRVTLLGMIISGKYFYRDFDRLEDGIAFIYNFIKNPLIVGAYNS